MSAMKYMTATGVIINFGNWSQRFCVQPITRRFNRDDSVAASCHLSLHAFNRSLFARGLSINSRAYVISQRARWPIRTPLPTCANQDAWVVITPRRSKANFIGTAVWHAWTRTLLLVSSSRLYFPQYIFPHHLSSFGHRAILIWADRDMAGGCS